MRILVVVLLLLPLASQAQETTLAEEARVTAFDVLVEVGPPAASDSEVEALPRRLEAEDFRVHLGGSEMPVVGFLDPRRDERGPGFPIEPWTLVLYFDLGLAERATVRWAAGELAERLDDLLALGDIEIVVSEDGPVRVLAPTRDSEVIENRLAGLALDPGGFHEAVELRAEALDAMREAPEETAATDWVNSVVSLETARVGRRLDQLLLYLVDREPSGAKKALLWVTDGFDREPAAFYRQRGVELPLGRASLSAQAEELTRSLSSYGWITIALAPPPVGPGLVPGKRFGKWLYRLRMPTGLIGGKLVHEEHRDPERAAAYIEIGQTHLAQGDFEAAEEAFEKALYRFAGDPRTSRDQAEAKAGLGRAVEAQDRPVEARQAFRHAVELDPTLAALYPQSQVALLAPAAVLETASLATAGRVAPDSRAVKEALSSLGRRARLTYSVSGWPRGELVELGIGIKGSSFDPRYPRWARSGTPEAIAAARARLVAGGELFEGGLEIAASLAESDEAGEKTELNVSFDERSGGRFGWKSDETAERDGRAHRLRISVAVGGRDRATEVSHETVELAPDLNLDDWLYRKELEEPGAEDWVAVVVEDIESGIWGAGLAE